MAVKDGGFAFPRGIAADSMGGLNFSGNYPNTGGMSLRDYFAAKAMQAEIITSCSDATPESAEALIEAAEKNGQTISQRIAFNAYQWADAMLAERKKAGE